MLRIAQLGRGLKQGCKREGKSGPEPENLRPIPKSDLKPKPVPKNSGNYARSLKCIPEIRLDL